MPMFRLSLQQAGHMAQEKLPSALALRSLKVRNSFTNSWSHDKLASGVVSPKFMAP